MHLVGYIPTNENSYNKEDLQTYKALLIKTNAHKRDYSESGQIMMVSQQAGHSNHINEITSIIEELKEADIIE